MNSHIYIETSQSEPAPVTTIEQAESNFAFMTNNAARTAELVGKVRDLVESGDSIEEAYAKVLDFHTQEALANVWTNNEQHTQ